MAASNKSTVHSSEHDVDQYQDYQNNSEGCSDFEEKEEREEAMLERKTEAGYSSRTKPKNAELQAYFDVLAEQMALDKLHESMKRRDPNMLTQAIKEFEDLGLDKSTKESYLSLYNQAQAIQHDVNQYRKLLREARRSSRPEAKLLEDRLGAVKRIHLEPYLRDEVDKCRKLLEKVNVKERDTHILALDKKTMAEMKSYSRPSPLVHRIMTSALLLLGEDEETTSKWFKVQSLCNPDGKDGMLRRMMNFNPADIHPDISGRVRFLLKNISLADAKKASPGAGTFYVWSKRVIGEDPEDNVAVSEIGQGGSRANWGRGDYSESDSFDVEYAGQINHKDDDIVSGDDDDDDDNNYNARFQQDERKKKDDALYERTLQMWINKEKKIFADQKKEKDHRRTFEILPRSRPSQYQSTNRPGGLPGPGEQSYRGTAHRPKQSQQSSLRYM